MQTEENRPQQTNYYPYAYHNSTPTADEIKATEELLEYIDQNGLYDTEEAATRRARVVNRLSAMLRAWAVSIGTAKGVQDEQLLDGGGIQIQIYGSTKLEVHNYSSDMDLLCIAPDFLAKSDFFSSFCDTLSACPDVDNLLSIPEAYTPVIKFVMMGLSIDLVFTSLQISRLTGTIDVLDLRCLRGLDEPGVRSLNGLRVAEWICKLVPNIKTYRVALRAIKHWAKQRGIYSNVLGFLGGINYAILVAMICQQYQNATPFVLIQKFFAIYTVWPWPTPVILRRFEDLLFKDTDGRYFPVWNPISNFKDSLHIMPIITPAYPSMNSAYNVTMPQFRAVQEELIRGNDIFQNHQPGNPFPWSRLFDSSTEEFFSKYPRYIQIDVSAPNAMDHRKWFGWVESRVRLLILSLEQPPAIFCHPIANCFHRQPHQKLTHHAGSSPSPLTNSTVSTENGIAILEDVIASQTDSQTGIINLVTPQQEGVTLVTPKKSYITDIYHSDDVFISSFFIAISLGQQQHRVDFAPQINEFKEKVLKWPNLKPDMKLHIQIFDHEHVPVFIQHTKAEPSGMESCTPNVNRYQNGSNPRQTSAVVASGGVDVHHSGHGRSSHNNRHHDIDDHHNRLVHNHHHSHQPLGRSESQSFQSHTISFESPDDEEHGIQVNASRSTDSAVVHPTNTAPNAVMMPTAAPGIINPSVHLGTPTSTHKTMSPMNHHHQQQPMIGTPRSNRSNISNHSAFETYRDVVGPVPTNPTFIGDPSVMLGHNVAHHPHPGNMMNQAPMYTGNGGNPYKYLNSPKHHTRSKIPQSPKSPNYSNHSSNNSKVSLDQFPYMNGVAQPRPQRQNNNYQNHNNRQQQYNNIANPTRRPSSSTFSSSSAEIEDIHPVIVASSNPPAPVAPIPSVVVASNGIANQVQPQPEPPLTFGSLPPVSNSTSIDSMRTSPSIQPAVVLSEQASPAARITPKRSRNELNGGDAQF